MPTYEYQCESCGHQFEKSQKISADPIKVCPVCEGKVKRLISGGNFILNGKGWYKTDYAASLPAPAKPSCGESPACTGCPSAK